MKALIYAATDETAGVRLDKDAGIFEISGRSLPEDSAEFFEPILDWVREYAKNPNPETHFVFKLDYFNTASSKFIQDMLVLLEGVPGVKVKWFYFEDDESMEEAGNEFAELVQIPFEFTVVH